MVAMVLMDAFDTEKEEKKQKLREIHAEMDELDPGSRRFKELDKKALRIQEELGEVLEERDKKRSSGPGDLSSIF